VSIHEHTPARNLTSNASGCRVGTPAGPIHADRVVLGTNAFPSLVARNRFHTVPVWDYVLATEPLSAEQLDRVGWRHRQGIADSNGFRIVHRPRRSTASSAWHATTPVRFHPAG
jgi:glycine/D-amino acid oxidase-like deaminating enzyme